MINCLCTVGGGRPNGMVPDSEVMRTPPMRVRSGASVAQTLANGVMAQSKHQLPANTQVSDLITQRLNWNLKVQGQIPFCLRC
jgi:hypothetical protein